MKKIYSTPQVYVTRIETERLMSDSLTFKSGDISDENSVLVKGGNSASSSSSYNVWNDDWSE